ncbi:MAG: hypothetical protein RL701_7272 [Pseudomonadota bacterium]
MHFPKRRSGPKPKSKPNVSELAAAPAAPARRADVVFNPAGREVEPPTPQSRDLPEELIAARAYEIWQSRGCPMGQDSVSDWLAARTQLERERVPR